MSKHPVAMHDTRQLSTRLILLALLIATIAALSLSVLAQVRAPQNGAGQNVPRPHSGDQVWQFKSGPVPLHMPQKLYQCEAGQCGPWVFNGATGEGRWPHGGAVAELTVEKFDYDGIIIHRRDVRGNTPGLTAVYTGKIVDDQIKGEVTWTWSGFGGRSPHTVWGATVMEPQKYSVIDANLPCRHYDVSADALMNQAGALIYLKRYAEALCWFRIAADKGDTDAQGLAAAFLYQGGDGITKDIPAAIAYAQKGAAAGDYTAEAVLSRAYQDGALPKDQAKSDYWRAKSKADSLVSDEHLKGQEDEFEAFKKEAMKIQNINETAMNHAIQQRQQQQNFAGTLMLTIILGAMIAEVGGGSGGSSGGSFEQNRRDAISRQCMGGDSYACHQQDPLNSDYDH